MVGPSITRAQSTPQTFLGHRGSPDRENTLQGISQALEVGLDGVEIDLQLSVDGKVVVFHDDDFVRLSGRKVRLSELTVKDIKKIPLHGGGVVPTLAEVLQHYSKDQWLNLELKAGGEELVRATVECLKSVPWLMSTACSRIVFSSFDPNMLATAVTSRSGGCEKASFAMLLHAQTPAWLHKDGGAELGADAVHLPSALCSRERVDAYLALGFVVGAWGAKSARREQELLDMGVKRIITDLIEAR